MISNPLEVTIGEESTKQKRQKLSEAMRGKNNPNYGNKWTDDQKGNQSAKLKKHYEEPSARYKAGNSNRGKRFSAELIHRMHGHRTSDSYSHPHTNEVKSLIGKLSKEKWTEEYKAQHRTTMEQRGYWVPLSQKQDYEIYFKQSDWNHQMYPLLEVDNLIENKVRDHIIPRHVGFEYGVFPEIMRHPLNCQIISRAHNVRKGMQDRRKNDWKKEIENLIKQIASYDGDWHEQTIATTQCNLYTSGKRWVNTNKKEVSGV